MYSVNTKGNTNEKKKKMSIIHITRAPDSQSHLRVSFGVMLQKQSMVDMTLICSSHSIRVHKSVLSANSIYLESVISQHKEDVIIVLRDTSFEAMRGLVEFMYCGHTRIEELHLKNMMACSKHLMVTGLSNLHNVEGRIYKYTNQPYTSFELTSLEHIANEVTTNRPVIFIRRSEKTNSNTAKTPVVMEIHPLKNSTKNRKDAVKPSNLPSNENNYFVEVPDAVKHEANAKFQKNSEDLQRAMTEEMLRAADDVEILRIPFELKNNKPVRNQIKEYIGETMPELILKPRRGRPTSKPIMERSLIKNEGLFQIILDNTDDTLKCEENLSKRTIAKMEKQMYGRDVQQQYVIEQAVSSIVDNRENYNDTNIHNISGLQVISASPNPMINNDLQNENVFTDMSILLNDGYYTNEVLPQTLSYSDLQALNSDGTLEYQNLDELSINNNLAYDGNNLNFTVLPPTIDDNIEYTYLESETQLDGDSVVFNANEIPVLQYDTNPLFMNQLNYGLDDDYYGDTNMNNPLVLQSDLINFQYGDQTLVDMITDSSNQEISLLGLNDDVNNILKNENMIFAESELPSNILETDSIETDMVNNDVDNVYESDTDIFQVVQNNKDISNNNDYLKFQSQMMNNENDLLNTLQDNDDVLNALQDNNNVLDVLQNNNDVFNTLPSHRDGIFNSFQDNGNIPITGLSNEDLNLWLQNSNFMQMETISSSPEIKTEKSLSSLNESVGNLEFSEIMNRTETPNSSIDTFDYKNSNYAEESDYSYFCPSTSETIKIENSSPEHCLNTHVEMAKDISNSFKFQKYCRRTNIKENMTMEDDNELGDVPKALGLLPVRSALEKIQNLSERKPRQTRANAQIIMENKRSSDSPKSERSNKKRRISRRKDNLAYSK